MNYKVYREDIQSVYMHLALAYRGGGGSLREAGKKTPLSGRAIKALPPSPPSINGR